MWLIPCSHTQILGGDLAGVIESADADSKVTLRGIPANLQQALAQHVRYAAVYLRGQGVCSFSRLELHIKMGYGADNDIFNGVCVVQTAH